MQFFLYDVAYNTIKPILIYLIPRITLILADEKKIKIYKATIDNYIVTQYSYYTNI